MFFFTALRCDGVVDALYDLADAGPEQQIGKHLHDATVIGKRSFLHHVQVFHQPVMDNIFHNPIDKTYLPAVEICIAKKLRKSLFYGIYIEPHDATHKLTQGLLSAGIFIALPGAEITPQNSLQLFHSPLRQGDIALQLCGDFIVLVLADIELALHRGDYVFIAHAVYGEGPVLHDRKTYNHAKRAREIIFPRCHTVGGKTPDRANGHKEHTQRRDYSRRIGLFCGGRCP